MADSDSEESPSEHEVECYCTKCHRFTGCKGKPGCTCSCPFCVPTEIAIGAGAGVGAGAAAESGSH